MAKVVDGVSLSIDRGEVVGLVGESGCGKTLTTKAILGILPGNASVSSGHIFFRDVDLLTMRASDLNQVRGMDITLIPQESMNALCPVFTVGDQMEDYIMWRGTSRVGVWRFFTNRFNHERRDIKKAIPETLRQVALADPERVSKSYPFQLSGGQRERILISLALYGKPALIIADEPGTGLDVTVQRQVLELFRDLIRREHVSVLYITHDLGVAKSICDRIYVMYAGNVVESSTVEDLFAAPKHPYTSGLLDSVPRISRGIGDGIPGRLPDYLNPPQGCRFHPRCPRAMEICSTTKPSVVPVETGHDVACHLYPQ